MGSQPSTMLGQQVEESIISSPGISSQSENTDKLKESIIDKLYTVPLFSKKDNFKANTQDTDSELEEEPTNPDSTYSIVHPQELSRFVGREHELECLNHLFVNGIKVAILTGVHGCGKTWIALEYASRQSYNVLHINAETLHSLTLGLKIVALKFGIIRQREQYRTLSELSLAQIQEISASLVLHPTLVIFDNAHPIYPTIESVKPITTFLQPLFQSTRDSSSSLKIIITTSCSTGWETIFKPENILRIPPFSETESYKFIANRLESIPRLDSDRNWSKLAEFSNHLPLSLEIFTAAITKYSDLGKLPWTVDDFLADFGEQTLPLNSPEAILALPSFTDFPYLSKIRANFMKLFENFELYYADTGERALQILDLLSLLCSHGVDLQILIELLQRMGARNVESVCESASRLATLTLQALRLLESFHMIQIRDSLIITHCLVQETRREQLHTAGKLISLVSRIAKSLYFIFSWEAPHVACALSFAQNIQPYLLQTEVLHAIESNTELLNHFPIDMTDLVYAKLYEARVELYGPDSSWTVASRNNYVRHLLRTGRTSQVIFFLQQHHIRQRDLYGIDGQQTLETRNVLIHSWIFLGTYSDAWNFLQPELTRQRKLLGPNDSRTLLTRNLIVLLFHYLKRYDKALEILCKDYVRQVRILGDCHEDTLKTLNLISDSFLLAKRYKEARSFLKREYSARCSKLSSCHPVRLELRNKVLEVYFGLGKHGKALKLVKRDYKSQRKQLGIQNTLTLQTRTDLIQFLIKQKKPEKVLKILLKDYFALQKCLGTIHGDTLSTGSEIFNHLHACGSKKALELLRNEYHRFRQDPSFKDNHSICLEISKHIIQIMNSKGETNEKLALYIVAQDCERCKRELGADHPATVATSFMWVNQLERMHLYDDALTLLRCDYRTRSATLTKDHPTSLRTRNEIAKVFQLQGNHDNAITFLRIDFIRQRDHLGFDHVETLETRDTLWEFLSSMKKFQEALDIVEEDYVRQRDANFLGSDDSKTLNSRNKLVSSFMSLNQTQEALDILVKEHLRQQESLEEDDERTLETRDEIVKILRKQNKYDEGLFLLRSDYIRQVERYGPDATITEGSMQQIINLLQWQGQRQQSKVFIRNHRNRSKASKEENTS